MTTTIVRLHVFMVCLFSAWHLNSQIQLTTIDNNELFQYDHNGCMHSFSLKTGNRKSIFVPVVNNKTSNYCLIKNKIIIWSRYGVPARLTGGVIHQFDKPKLDSIELIKKERLYIDSLTQKLGTKKKAISLLIKKKQSRKNRKGLFELYFFDEVVKHEFFHEDLYGLKYQFDIVNTAPNTYKIFILFNKEFIVSEFDYSTDKHPIKFRGGKSHITYLADSIAFDYSHFNKYSGSRDRFLFARKNNYKYQSISDSLFFQGNFRVIRQKGELYCINTDHGGIYHIGERIEKIAQIENIKNYPEWLFGKAYFIEDRDRETLIFFQPIKKIKSTVPTPDYEVMDKIAFNKKFAKLLH